MEVSILLVDREANLIEHLQREFGGHHLRLRNVTSVESARSLIEEFTPDLLIIDADILGALELVAELRAASEPILTVGMTDSSERRERLHSLGMEKILLKHEGFRPVLDAVSDYIDPDGSRKPSDKMQVLVVDDEPDFLIVLSRLLRLWGYSPLTAGDAESALEIFESHPTISAILLDLRLPGMGGMELLKEIQRRNPNTGVIMLSAVSDREVAHQALKLGAFDYVTKPPDYAALQSTIVACTSHTEYQSQSWWKKLMG